MWGYNKKEGRRNGGEIVNTVWRERIQTTIRRKEGWRTAKNWGRTRNLQSLKKVGGKCRSRMGGSGLE